MSLRGTAWISDSPPRRGETIQQYIKRLVNEDPLTIQDAEEMRRKWARTRLDHDTRDEEGSAVLKAD